MRTEIFALCFTIAASIGGAAWILGLYLGGIEARISGVEQTLSARIDGVENRLARLESDVQDIRADIRSVNEFLRGKDLPLSPSGAPLQ